LARVKSLKYARDTGLVIANDATFTYYKLVVNVIQDGRRDEHKELFIMNYELVVSFFPFTTTLCLKKTSQL